MGYRNVEIIMCKMSCFIKKKSWRLSGILVLSSKSFSLFPLTSQSQEGGGWRRWKLASRTYTSVDIVLRHLPRGLSWAVCRAQGHARTKSGFRDWRCQVKVPGRWQDCDQFVCFLFLVGNPEQFFVFLYISFRLGQQGSRFAVLQ